MIDYQSMHIMLKIFAYPMTVMSVMFVLLYVGKYFCVTVFEDIYSEIDKEGSFAHGIISGTISVTVIWWLAWIYQIEILTVILSLFGTIFGLFSLLLIFVLFFQNGNPIIKFFVNIHHKIHERKHGKN